MKWAALSTLAAAFGLSLAGCSSGSEVPAGATTAAPQPSAQPAIERAAQPRPTALIDSLALCDVEHRGLLLDGGDDALVGRFGWDVAVPNGVQRVEHGGATWSRITQKKVDLSFLLPESARIFVATRAFGKSARSASVYLDDQPLGTLTFSRAEPKVVSTATTTLPADPGLHTISLRFSGRVRDEEALADIDWIRIGVPDDSPVTFGALTSRDVLAPNAALSGVPHRSVAMRAPGSLRCVVRPTETSVLHVAVGMTNPGQGSVLINVTREGQKPETIAQSPITGGDKSAWTDLRASLSPFAGQVVTLSLVAERAPKGGRILFGDPQIMDTGATPPVSPAARSVVMVVLNGVERNDLPPWSQPVIETLPTLSDLAQNATTFNAHRAPSTVTSAVMGSLVTGLSPVGHTLTDPAMRLPTGVTTLAEVAHDAAIRTGMFTGVPHTFKAFGFAQGWEKSFEHAPSSGDSATAPIDAAVSWVNEIPRTETSARLLMLVHARGGHPPWHVTPKELSTLPPTDYSGPIEPRRAAQTIAKARKKRNRDVLSQTDRDRIRGLQMMALSAQDRALGALVAALKTTGLWDTTLFIVTSDVSSGASIDNLFGDGLPLTESVLTLPLYVHFPGNVYAGVHVAGPTEVMDVAYTAFAALGLDAGKRSGRDLAQVASGLSFGPSVPQIATLDTFYSARWGSLVLSGRSGAPPFLCDLALDPTCAVNRRETMPASAYAMFRRIVMADLAARTGKMERELAAIDEDTAAQLKVWGATSD
ncbi:MAG: sulfatase-like hydrolase/transferase [Polyangiaceae bacterium]|nr:sulfatase-like hydrolase/transferase [Polyangiaceae bacterium]